MPMARCCTDLLYHAAYAADFRRPASGAWVGDPSMPPDSAALHPGLYLAAAHPGLDYVAVRDTHGWLGGPGAPISMVAACRCEAMYPIQGRHGPPYLLYYATFAAGLPPPRFGGLGW